MELRPLLEAATMALKFARVALLATLWTDKPALRIPALVLMELRPLRLMEAARPMALKIARAAMLATLWTDKPALRTHALDLMELRPLRLMEAARPMALKIAQAAMITTSWTDKPALQILAPARTGRLLLEPAARLTTPRTARPVVLATL
jgi:hypothetical protein